MRARLIERRRRLRASARPLLQASLAATIAWLLASVLLGHEQPIFAPISAVVAVGATFGQSWRHSLEIVVGVAIGVGIADVLATLIGQGALQIGVVVLAAMGVSLLLGGSAMFVVQAGTAAAVVAALPTVDVAASIDRIVDSFVGGIAAVFMTVLALPVSPVRLARRTAAPVLDQLATSFDNLAVALTKRDAAGAERALELARATGDMWAELDEIVGVGRQAARISPARRGEADVISDVAQCVVQLDFAIRDGRTMARVGWRLIETGYRDEGRLGLAVHALADAVRALDGHLHQRPDSTQEARRAARRAARYAASVPRGIHDAVLAHLIGQIRSTSVDLLRATGMMRDDALELMLDAVSVGRRERAGALEPGEIDEAPHAMELATPELDDLARLRRRLERAWDRDTSAFPDRWSADAGSIGHGDVAALVVQDMFGGTILRGIVAGQHHFWNRFDDGSEIDLTRDQFAVWSVRDVQVRNRQFVLSIDEEGAAGTAHRHGVLAERLTGRDVND